MKTSKPNYYNEIINCLQELKTLYPDYSMGKHLSTIIDEYGDIWGTTDKELAYAIKKYKAQLELYVPTETNGDELENIVKDAMHLSSSDLLSNNEDF